MRPGSETRLAGSVGVALLAGAGYCCVFLAAMAAVAGSLLESLILAVLGVTMLVSTGTARWCRWARLVLLFMVLALVVSAVLMPALHWNLTSWE